MIKWLREQGWGALRVWARRCRRLSAAQRAAEAFRLTQPPVRRTADESKQQEIRGKTGREYDRHVSPWLRRNRALWVHVAESAAAGRPSMLKIIPGSHMYKTLSRGASMRRPASMRRGRGSSVRHNDNSRRGLKAGSKPAVQR